MSTENENEKEEVEKETNEVIIYEICDFLSCWYGLKHVPKDLKQKIIDFLKENGAKWEETVSRIDRETKIHYYFYSAPPKDIKKIDFSVIASKLGIKIKVVPVYSVLLFLHNCDHEVLEDEDHFFS
jgi:hypothetical protein